MKIAKTLMAGLFLAAPALWAKPTWRTVHIPLLPAGASLGPLWSSFSGDVYVWSVTQGGASGDVPTSHLLHWDGEKWRVDLKLPGHAPAGVFGTDARNVFVAANKCAAGTAAGCGRDRGGRLFRSTDRGATWAPQSLPFEAEGVVFGRLDGSFENVQAVMNGNSLLRFDGMSWNVVFTAEDGEQDKSLAVSFQSANEGYLASCGGWGRWVDGGWKFMPVDFGFCDARGLWGLRDRSGQLRLYAADNHRFSNGIRVWRFSPTMEDFQTEVEEESPDEDGSAEGLWGSAEDDIYAIGRIGDGAKPGSGRVYHYDGVKWTRETSMGPIPAALGIHGTSRNDVWIALADGRLLHYSTAVTLSRKMAGSLSAAGE